MSWSGALLSALALLFIGSAWGADATTCTPMIQVIMGQPGYTFFATAFNASDLNLTPGQKYTVFAVADEPFMNLLKSYNFDTSSEASLAADSQIARFGVFLKYYLLPGAYSLADLEARKSDVRTLFNPPTDGIYVCQDPDATAGEEKPRDGDVGFVLDGSNVLHIQDDSEKYPDVKVQGDLVACEGYVHLIDGVLDPCCPDVSTVASGTNCVMACLDPLQLDNTDAKELAVCNATAAANPTPTGSPAANTTSTSPAPVSHAMAAAPAAAFFGLVLTALCLLT